MKLQQHKYLQFTAIIYFYNYMIKNLALGCLVKKKLKMSFLSFNICSMHWIFLILLISENRAKLFWRNYCPRVLWVKRFPKGSEMRFSKFCKVFISYSNAQRLETAMKNCFIFWRGDRIGRIFINLSNFENSLCDKIFGKICSAVNFLL